MRQKNPNMVGGQKKKVVMKPPQVVRVGARKTSFVNFTEICKLYVSASSRPGVCMCLLLYLCGGFAGCIDNRDTYWHSC